MDADDVMDIVSERLNTKEAFKLWRMLDCRIVLSSAMISEMHAREPELFEKALPDRKGYVYFPWQEGYARVREGLDPHQGESSEDG